jgi:hypothetical protein
MSKTKQKKCTKCKTIKPVNSFYTNNFNGYQNTCKQCLEDAQEKKISMQKNFTKMWLKANHEERRKIEQMKSFLK